MFLTWNNKEAHSTIMKMSLQEVGEVKSWSAALNHRVEARQGLQTSLLQLSSM